MHTSGLSVNQELKSAFVAVQEDPSLLYLKITIESETFKKGSTGKSTGSRKTDFQAIKGVLEPKKPCYVLMRAQDSSKWVLILYVPELAFVRDKMVFASSMSALKEGLGNSQFIGDFSISTPEECTVEEYEHTVKEVSQKDVMTIQEQLKHDAQNESILSMGESKVSAMIDIPIKVSDEAKASLEKVGKGTVDTVIYRMNPDTEVLEVDTAGNLGKIEAITAKFPKAEPRFVIHNFPHDHDGQKAKSFVFFYFCPDVAKPRLKMMYSSCKGIVIKLALQAGIDLKKNIEASQPDEITPSVVLTELYPKKDEKVAFKKPTAGGAKGKSRFRGKQFDAGATVEPGDDL